MPIDYIQGHKVCAKQGSNSDPILRLDALAERYVTTWLESGNRQPHWRALFPCGRPQIDFDKDSNGATISISSASIVTNTEMLCVCVMKLLTIIVM